MTNRFDSLFKGGYVKMLHSKTKKRLIITDYNDWCFIQSPPRFGLDDASHYYLVRSQTHPKI